MRYCDIEQKEILMEMLKISILDRSLEIIDLR